jgi:similar to stage IV sporulation protein
VQGNRSVDTASILKTLEECGVGVGRPSAGLDMGSVENRFLILSDDISWISVNIRGTVAEVEVREFVAGEQDNDFAASNLVATRNGRVLEFDRVKGDIQVQIGEDVSEGQLLVGGVYGSETSPLRFVRAQGGVIALCEREYTVSVPLEFEKKVYTGRTKAQKSIIFLNKEIKLFANSRNPYESCDIIEEERYIDFFGLGKLPFGIRTRTYAEYQTHTAVRTEQQASEQATFELWQQFATDAPDALLVGKHLVTELGEREYILRARIESVENIAKEVEIKIELFE